MALHHVLRLLLVADLHLPCFLLVALLHLLLLLGVIVLLLGALVFLLLALLQLLVLLVLAVGQLLALLLIFSVKLSVAGALHLLGVVFGQLIGVGRSGVTVIFAAGFTGLDDSMT